MTGLSPEAKERLAWALKWEADHPDALGWIGDPDRMAFETGPFGELRRRKLIRAETTDGFGHPLFHIQGEVPPDESADAERAQARAKHLGELAAEREMVQAQTPVVNVEGEAPNG